MQVVLNYNVLLVSIQNASLNHVTMMTRSVIVDYILTNLTIYMSETKMRVLWKVRHNT